MKKTITLELNKCLKKDLTRDQHHKVIANEFRKPFKSLGEFIIQQIFKGNKLPKRLEIYMEIWRGTPTKRGVRVIIGKHTLDNLKKCDRYRVVLRDFIAAFEAMGYFLADNIRQVKRLPEKVVIEVEVK